MSEYRCGCCLFLATAKYKVAWCNRHDMYECEVCWEHDHDTETEDWGADQEDTAPAGP